MIEFLKTLLGSGKKHPKAKTLASIEDFPKLNNDERIRQVIFCGDSGDLRYYLLLKYAILNDPDKDVKMAALKRIHLFATHPDAIPFMKDLSPKINVYGIEPYYSMALNRLQLISTDEFKTRVDNGFK